VHFKNLSYLNRKGPRYIRQRDNYSCAAVALLNADKWRGKKVTYSDLPKYRKVLSVDNKRGPSAKKLHDFLMQDPVIKYYFESPTLKEVDSILERNGILYTICLDRGSSKSKSLIKMHAFLITSKTRKGYKCIGVYSASHTITFLSRNRLSRILRRKSKTFDVKSKAWPIYKKEENLDTV
jgi:hypothetical protein